jgi:hypothetical protein
VEQQGVERKVHVPLNRAKDDFVITAGIASVNAALHVGNTSF